MQKLGDVLPAVANRMGAPDDAARIARRTAQVHVMFKDAVEHLYKENARYVLDHVNAVYIKKEPAGTTLSVYMDDGNFRSDIHSRQHFIILWLKERYNENIDVFKAYPSRFNMKTRHPYAETADNSRTASAAPRGQAARMSTRPLSTGERAYIDSVSSSIEDEALRKSFLHAMEKSLQASKAEDGS